MKPLTRTQMGGAAAVAGIAGGALAAWAVSRALEPAKLPSPLPPGATPEQLRAGYELERLGRAADAQASGVMLDACRSALRDAETKLSVLGGAIAMAPPATVLAGTLGTLLDQGTISLRAGGSLTEGWSTAKKVTYGVIGGVVLATVGYAALSRRR